MPCRARPAQEGGPPRVLLVDDDPNLLASLRRLLQPGYALRTAGSGAEALALLEAEGPFQVLISDLKMPGMDGITLLSWAAKRHPDTVRVLLTGYADFQNAVDAVNQGFVYRFLSKPCQPEVLRQAVEDALRQHGLVQAQRELHSLKRFKRLLEGIVQGLSALVEARDPYLAGHQTRVADLACAMGARLGLDAERLEILRVAALLHDIGKVQVPADFLNRPGPLRESEMAIVRTHPEKGYDVLKHLGEDWPVAGIIGQHHERVDGSGYPRGLKGPDIDPGARILAVADVVDAMCSHRPYRPSLGIAAALAEIRLNRGRLYGEPEADICLELFEQEGYSLADPSGKSREDWLSPLDKPSPGTTYWE